MMFASVRVQQRRLQNDLAKWYKGSWIPLKLAQRSRRNSHSLGGTLERDFSGAMRKIGPTSVAGGCSTPEVPLFTARASIVPFLFAAKHKASWRICRCRSRRSRSKPEANMIHDLFSAVGERNANTKKEWQERIRVGGPLHCLVGMTTKVSSTSSTRLDFVFCAQNSSSVHFQIRILGLGRIKSRIPLGHVTTGTQLRRSS
jgi:hypothetical protein